MSLGSNMGDRVCHLRAALDGLRHLPGTEVLAVSNAYETEPLGEVQQPAFLNVAAEIETDLGPLELLNAAQTLEKRLGRTPSYSWGPRCIDIDIILWGPQTMATDRLTLPHAAFRTRAFVLTPLAEIAPDAVDPVSGKSVAELAAAPDAQGRLVKLGTIAP
jgi:2-amino-4-hydroxy-6-hydroxymethyldihydropteridine diphosphokinase